MHIHRICMCSFKSYQIEYLVDLHRSSKGLRHALLRKHACSFVSAFQPPYPHFLFLVHRLCLRVLNKNWYLILFFRKEINYIVLWFWKNFSNHGWTNIRSCERRNSSKYKVTMFHPLGCHAASWTGAPKRINVPMNPCTHWTFVSFRTSMPQTWVRSSCQCTPTSLVCPFSWFLLPNVSFHAWTSPLARSHAQGAQFHN